MRIIFKKSKYAIIFLITIILLFSAYYIFTYINLSFDHRVGDVVDNFNGIKVHFNGAVNHTEGRNTAGDGYNIGLKYQCVEFVKRYYYKKLSHKMPDSYGHAKDFFQNDLEDGQLNKKRNLLQYKNGSKSKPAKEDILVFKPWLLNPYGHVAIVTEVGPNEIEIVQQNPGPFGASRERFRLVYQDGLWFIENNKIYGWLRKTGQ